MQRDQIEATWNSCLDIQKEHEGIVQRQSEVNFMEHFIQEKYSQVKDLQSYLVQELQLIQSNKKKQIKIEQMITTTLAPTVSCLKDILEGVKSFLLTFNSLEENSILIVAEKCKDLLAEKQLTHQRQSQQILKLKLEVISMKEELQHKALRINLLQKNVANKQSKKQEAQEPEITFKRNVFIEKPTKKSEKSDYERLFSKQKPGNSPYRLNQQPNNRRERTPLKERFGNPSPAKNQQNVGSSLMNKTININYRCERPQSSEKLTPSKSTEKLSYHKISKKFIDEPQTRKDYIKQKIQNLKQKNSNLAQYKK